MCCYLVKSLSIISVDNGDASCKICNYHPLLPDTWVQSTKLGFYVTFNNKGHTGKVLSIATGGSQSHKEVTACD